MAQSSTRHQHISFYFVLYIVAIVTVFVITMERDQLLRQRDEDIAHLIEVYVKPLRLSAFADTARFVLDLNQPVARDPMKIRAKTDGPVDKNDVSFTLVGARRQLSDGGWDPMPVAGTMENENGDGVLTTSPLDEGVYEFIVAGYKKRIAIEDGKMKVRIRDTVYTLPYSPRLEKVDRDTTTLVAKVVRGGIIAPQLTLSIQETNEHWVLGPPFQKKIFVGGIEDLAKVIFSAGPVGTVQRTPGAGSSVTMIWEGPTLGQHSFTVGANANRGLGEKDKATITFSVDVLPATFSSTPSQKGFWGIPYVFDGQIVGVNPLDLTVERSHDGQPLGIKPAVPKDTVIPDRSWGSLQFKVLYHGATIKEHRATLSAPPPPQIKWVQQNLDRTRNVFLINATSSDPVGGPVRLSLQAQPSGIAQLDKIKGTAFTITINLEGKPTAVFVKLTATDQYGGQSTSSKQFNIPQ